MTIVGLRGGFVLLFVLCDEVVQSTSKFLPKSGAWMEPLETPIMSCQIELMQSPPSSQMEAFVCHPMSDDGLASQHFYQLELSIQDHEDLLRLYLEHELDHQETYAVIEGNLSKEPGILAPTRVSALDKTAFDNQRRRSLTTSSRVVGDYTLLVVRVSTSDAEPTYSAEDLFELTFDAPVSLKSQLEACSFHQFRLAPNSYGVMDVTLDNITAHGTNYPVLVEAAYDQALELVNERVDDLRELADFVMFVLPSGTNGDWRAFAAIPGKQSVFNNEWAGFIGATAHELGHNLGLQHAYYHGEEYMGTAGYMGGAIKQIGFPQRCYNGQNHWQLGWFADRAIELDDEQLATPALYNVAAFVDYKKTTQDDSVVVRLSEWELYLQYNRATSFNKDPGMFGDMVTIDRLFEEGTDLLAGLNANNSLYFETRGTDTLVIEVCQYQNGTSSKPDVMQVSIGLGGSVCPKTTFSPTLVKRAKRFGDGTSMGTVTFAAIAIGTAAILMAIGVVGHCWCKGRKKRLQSQRKHKSKRKIKAKKPAREDDDFSSTAAPSEDNFVFANNVGCAGEDDANYNPCTVCWKI